MGETLPARAGGRAMPPAPARMVRPERALVAAGGALLAATYLLTYRPTSDAFIAAALGLGYADQVARGPMEALLHPHHVLYHLAGLGLARLLAPFLDAPQAALLALRLLSAAGGGAAAVIMYLLVRRLTGQRFPAAVTALSLAWATGFWHYASVPETHAPAVAATLGVLLAVARAAERPTARAFLGVGLVHALAVVLRQDAVLLAPLGALLALFWGEAGRGWSRAAAYGLGLGVPAAATYLAIYALGVRGRGTFTSLGHWLTMYAGWGHWGLLSHVTRANFLLTLRGALATVNVGLSSARFLPGAAALVAGAALCLRHLAMPVRLVTALAAAFFLLRLAFITWWDPSDAFVYGVDTSPALFVLAGVAAGGTGRGTGGAGRAALRLALASLVPAMFWTSLTAFILPMRAEGHFRAAQQWARATRPQDLILSNDGSLVMALTYMTRRDAHYLPLYLDPAWGVRDEAQFREVLRRRVATGGRVFLTGEVMRGETVVYGLSVWEPRGGFERRFPAGDYVTRAVRDGLRWQPVVLGEGPGGGASGYELVSPGGDAGARAPRESGAAAGRPVTGRPLRGSWDG